MQNLILIPLRPQLSQGRLRCRLIFTFVNYAYRTHTYSVSHFPLWIDQLLVILFKTQYVTLKYLSFLLRILEAPSSHLSLKPDHPVSLPCTSSAIAAGKSGIGHEKFGNCNTSGMLVMYVVVRE